MPGMKKKVKNGMMGMKRGGAVKKGKKKAKKQTMLDVAKKLYKEKKISKEVLTSLERHEKSKDIDLKS